MRIALVTGADMPRPDHEVHALAAHLAARGHDASVRRWTETGDWNVDLAVVRSPWDYVGQRDTFLRWAAATEEVTTLANPASVLSANSHKSYLVDLSHHGLPVPALSLLDAGAGTDAQRRVLDSHPGRVVIKPAVGSGARGAVLVDTSAPEAPVALEEAVAHGDTLVQEYCPGIAEGEVSAVFIAGRLSHAVRKVPAPGDFRVNSHYGGSMTPVQLRPEEAAVARAAIDAVGAGLLYARVDLVGTPDGPALMELELVEPDLYLRSSPGSLDTMAAAIESWPERGR